MRFGRPGALVASGVPLITGMCIDPALFRHRDALSALVLAGIAMYAGGVLGVQSRGEHLSEVAHRTGGELTEPTMEERIRERAYELWQQDGSLEGCADEYWRQAKEMVEQEIRVEQSAARRPTED